MSHMPSAKKVFHRCAVCGREYPHEFTTLCQCGGMIEVEYDLSRAKLYDSPNTYMRYFDLLPIERPESLLMVEQPPTPTVHACALGKELGLPKLYLKDETGLPTRSTKDRMAVCALSFMRETGVKAFATSSTGNSSTAFAHYIVHASEMRVFLFTAEDFCDRHNFAPNGQVVVFGLRGATFVEAFELAREYAARRKDITAERGFFNPGRRAGLKLAFLEAAESISEPIDWYVQAVSSAMGVYGTYQGARELAAMGRIRKLPRLLCVQQETCNPMVRAFQAGSEVIRPQDIVKRPTGIASAILRGDPSRVYPYVRRIVLESNGDMVSVSESEIREARKMVEELEHLHPCFTAATAVAGLIRLARAGRISPKDTVLVNLTGADREPRLTPTDVHWLVRTPEGWRLEDRSDHLGRELWE